MKRMLVYSIGQIRYLIIGIIVGDSNDGYAENKWRLNRNE